MLAVLAGSGVALADGGTDTLLPTPVSNPLSMPTTIVPILDTGRALILEKTGAVRVLEADDTMAANDALALPVCSLSEEGLLGAAVDPGFATNGYVYLYYTRNAGNCASSTQRFNRVSRFTMSGDTIDPLSEVVLLDNMNIPAGNHNGGDLHIGPDGDLYVSVGDGGTNVRGGSGSSAQDLSVLNGKILRITTTGGVPLDNPFVGQPGATACAMAGISAPTTAKCTEIYDYGLRNPYRFAFDPNTLATRFFINDVGESTWEEVDQGGAGLNYGWDDREGFCAYPTGTCSSTPPQYTDPLNVYNHSIGCNFITAGAFIPDGAWAAQYDGGYLFADGGCGKMWLRTAAGTVDLTAPFATTTGTIVDMTFLTHGAQTALYYVTNSSSQLRKITLPPGPGFHPPGSPQPTTPTTPITPTTPATPPTTTTTPPPPHGSARHCRIVAVRGLLAATARTRIAAARCRAHQVVIAMRHGRPVTTRHHRFVRAASKGRPRRSAGRHRTWTLRVEHVSQKVGSTRTVNSLETISVGWEATPTRVAHRHNAHFL